MEGPKKKKKKKKKKGEIATTGGKQNKFRRNKTKAVDFTKMSKSEHPFFPFCYSNLLSSGLLELCHNNECHHKAHRILESSALRV